MKKKDLKRKYKTDFLIVQEAVNSFDPYGLIKGGAPIDEYDFLTDIILSGIYRGKSNSEINQLVSLELRKAFGPVDPTKNVDQETQKLETLLNGIKTKIN
jgi:hypothetical protein